MKEGNETLKRGWVDLSNEIGRERCSSDWIAVLHMQIDRVLESVRAGRADVRNLDKALFNKSKYARDNYH